MRFRVNRFLPYASIVASDRTRKVFCSEVARVLREERVKRGLSMTLVAERAGLSQQMVSYVEREIRIPGLDTLLRITGAIGIDVADVVVEANAAANSKLKAK